MQLKLTVKELSKIVNVSPRNLRYYDNIGLFKASGTLENGYRYYTHDKIEEMHLISYLRHMGISIEEIKIHLENRNINEYGDILDKQLSKINNEILHMENIKKRLEKRIKSLEYIRHIPAFDKILIQRMPKRKILLIERNINRLIDWELSLIQSESIEDLPPSFFIGDPGFIVEMDALNKRSPEEFSGMFMFADDPFLKQVKGLKDLPDGRWITLYLKGNHHDASKRYKDILTFAKDKGLSLGNFALERTLIDHYISSDPNFYITEIQIPLPLCPLNSTLDIV